MTKFEPLGIGDYVREITIEPIENGYLVKRHVWQGVTAIIHCELNEISDVVASALPPMIKVAPKASARDYLID